MIKFHYSFISIYKILYIDKKEPVTKEEPKEDKILKDVKDTLIEEKPKVEGKIQNELFKISTILRNLINLK